MKNSILYIQEIDKEIEFNSLSPEEKEKIIDIWTRKCCEAIGYRIIEASAKGDSDI